MLAQDADSASAGPTLSRDIKLRSRTRKEDEFASSSPHKKGNLSTNERSKKGSLALCSSKSINCGGSSDPLIMASNSQSTGILDYVSRKEELVDESPGKRELNNDKSWKALEKALYEKGLEIFGKNR